MAGKLLSEAERLRVLREYQIVDTSSEKEFDDIAEIASAICDTPIALITLVEADRQWFKARVGLEVTETPRDHAFCAHTILESEPMVVPDATRDPRFADNPLVLGHPNIRFYAGAPLISPEGFGLGTLCVIDSKPRELDEKSIEALNALARQVVRLLELRRTSGQLADALARVKLLAGLLPVCAHCKSVREDGDYWRRVDEYLAELTGVQISHGICSDCLETHFSEVGVAG